MGAVRGCSSARYARDVGVVSLSARDGFSTDLYTYSASALLPRGECRKAGGRADVDDAVTWQHLRSAELPVVGCIPTNDYIFGAGEDLHGGSGGHE
jgi:hypothetical protein